MKCSIMYEWSFCVSLNKRCVVKRFYPLLSAALFLSLFCAVPAQADFLTGGDDGRSGDTGSPHFSSLARDLSPAVVNISVDSKLEDGVDGEAPGLLKREDAAPLQSVGSGFLVSEAGYIVTSNHVIDKAEKIIARLLNDKTEYAAEVVGKDAKTDIALLKIAAGKKLPFLRIGDSDKSEVGDWVMAIGNQFQLGQTVTAGIISAKSRRLNTRSSGPYDQFIQTDASINPGSSGGPLINSSGNVIGINTAIYSPGRTQFGGTGFNIGIGFAIPMSLAKGVLAQLKEQGKVTRGVLGVLIQPVTVEVKEALALSSPDGALVSDIVKGSPAEKAGFARRDVIVAYNGTAVRDHDDLPLMVANTPIGSEVSIDLIRQGRKETVTAKIDELKDDKAAPKKTEEEQKADDFGLVLQDVTSEIAKILDLSQAVGAVVMGVENGSIAERAGFMRGDVIEEVNGAPISDVKTYREALKSRKGEASLVLIRRKEGTRFLTLKHK